MAPSFSDAAKAKKLRDFFQQHGRIYIVVDATGDDIRVPEHLKGDPALRLVLNTRMPQPVHIHDDALASVFSFSGKSFPCHIPMRAIWAAYVPDESFVGILWENDVPETIRSVVKAVRSLEEDLASSGAEQDEGTHKITTKDDMSKKDKKIKHLRVVK